MKTKSTLLFLGILTIALTFRLYKINNPIADWHSWRQADTSAVTRNYIKHKISPLIPKFDDLSNIPSGKENPNGYRMVEFPVYNLFHFSIYKITLASCYLLTASCLTLEAAGRLTTAITSLVSIICLYLIVKKLSGKKLALLTSTIFTILPYNVYYSRVVLPDPMMVTFSLGAVYLFLLTTKQKKLHTSYYVLLTASAIFAAIALLIKPTAAFFLAPICYLAILNTRKSKNKLFHIILATYYLLLTAIPLLLWRKWIQQFPEGIPAYTWLFWGWIVPFQPAWFRWLFYERLTKLILGYTGVIFFTFGLFTLFKKTRRLEHQQSHPELISGSKKTFILPIKIFFQDTFRNDNFFYLVWLLSGLLYLITFSSGNVRHDYYQIPLIPITCIFVAKGISFLHSKITKLKTNYLLLTTYYLLLITSLYFSWNEIKGYYNINNPAIVEAGNTANKLLPSNAKVIAPYNGDTAFLYQTNRQGWPLMTNQDINYMIKLGATNYVSVNYDEYTKQLMLNYPILEQNTKFIIISLNQE